MFSCGFSVRTPIIQKNIHARLFANSELALVVSVSVHDCRSCLSPVWPCNGLVIRPECALPFAPVAAGIDSNPATLNWIKRIEKNGWMEDVIDMNVVGH